MKYFTWDDAKNEKLKAERGIGFEEIVFHIERGDVLDILEHPNRQRYKGQRIFVIARDAYVYLVPFVEDDRQIVLKTIIPSRKATKQYLDQEPDDEACPDRKGDTRFRRTRRVAIRAWREARAHPLRAVRTGHPSQGPSAQYPDL